LTSVGGPPWRNLARCRTVELLVDRGAGWDGRAAEAVKAVGLKTWLWPVAFGHCDAVPPRASVGCGVVRMTIEGRPHDYAISRRGPQTRAGWGCTRGTSLVRRTQNNRCLYDVAYLFSQYSMRGTAQIRSDRNQIANGPPPPSLRFRLSVDGASVRDGKKREDHIRLPFSTVMTVLLVGGKCLVACVAACSM
jgi:hypothetical protein